MWYEARVSKVWATLRTLGILLGLWAILIVVGLITGAIPLRGGAPEASTGERDAPEAVADAGAEAGDAGTAEEPPASPDAGAPDESEPAPARTQRPQRWAVCPAGADPTLAAAQLTGDERPELIVGCADRWEVIATTSPPARVLVLTAPPPPDGVRARTGPAASGDVDGDGTPDLVLPLQYETAQGASRGGGLYWVPRDAFGGIREPILLAPIAAFDAAVAPIDGQRGADVAAMNRANALAQLPSEAWVFGGGSAPARIAALRAGIAGAAVRIADLDRDGHADLVGLARDRVLIAFGDGRGTFPRTRAFELAGAREIALGDVDGDGGVDLAVLGDGLWWIRAGALDGMEPRPIEGAPTSLRGLSVQDADGDGKLDFVGWDHPRLVVLRQQGEVEFALETQLTLAGAMGPRRHLWLDLDADGATDDVVLLGTASDDGPLELVLVTDVTGGVEIAPSDDVAPIPDAPLVLRARI